MMHCSFTAKKCVPCEGGMAPLTKEVVDEYHNEIPGWEIAADYHSLVKSYRFKNFAQAMQFVGQVAVIAEKEGHHPGITISYNKVRLVLITHAIGGLSENDFIVAAKINTLELAV